MSTATKEWTTAAEFLEISRELGPCELVRGEVVPLSPGGLAHSRITMHVAGLLWEWERRGQRGRTFTGETGLIVESGPDTVRGADVAYYSDERLPRGTNPEGFCRTPPELVVEVVGKGQGWREMVEKAGEYLRMGVDRVWVLDPQSRRVHVFRPDAEPAVFSEADPLIDEPILPGFACTVGEFFAD